MRRIAAWALYIMGDAVSRVMNLAEPFGVLYPAYNRLMGWSSIVQGPSDRGPWDEMPELPAIAMETQRAETGNTDSVAKP